jgi:hypothetical protein
LPAALPAPDPLLLLALELELEPLLELLPLELPPPEQADRASMLAKATAAAPTSRLFIGFVTSLTATLQIRRGDAFGMS